MFTTAELRALCKLMVNTSLPHDSYGHLLSAVRKMEAELLRREPPPCKCKHSKSAHKAGRYKCNACPCATYGAINV